MQTFKEMVFEKKTDKNGVEYLAYTQAFVDYINRAFSYKGQKFIFSLAGVKLSADFVYTMDKLASTGDRNIINLDNDAVKRTDYTFTENQCLAIEAGTIYHTDSSRARMMDTYDRVVPEEVAEYYYANELEKDDSVNEAHCVLPTALTPSQVEHYLNQCSRDTSLMGKRRAINPGAATILEFSVLATEDGEHLYEFVTGAKFTEQVVSILKVVGPFAGSFDIHREVLSKKECVQWLFM